MCSSDVTDTRGICGRYDVSARAHGSAFVLGLGVVSLFGAVKASSHFVHQHPDIPQACRQTTTLTADAWHLL